MVEQKDEVEVLIKNQTKNLIYIYSLNEDIRSGNKMILSNDFKKFFKFYIFSKKTDTTFSLQKINF